MTHPRTGVPPTINAPTSRMWIVEMNVSDVDPVPYFGDDYLPFWARLQYRQADHERWHCNRIDLNSHKVRRDGTPGLRLFDQTYIHYATRDQVENRDVPMAADKDAPWPDWFYGIVLAHWPKGEAEG